MTNTLRLFQMRCGALLSLLILACIAVQGQEHRQIDVQKSKLTVRVYKSGLFSAFAHDHEITAPITHGVFQEANPSVELTVDARKLRVVDPEVSDKDRTEIQATMLSAKVLEAEKFPEISFRSSKIEGLGGDKWAVQGDLTLHGHRGSATVLQKDFGIEPIRIAGGSVKVKNEVRIEFEIVGH